jgi:2'-5' RNA ligase
MAVNDNGGPFVIPPEQRLNIFALVIYIPAPLGRFLDDLRTELVPHYKPHAHVSVLPPRSLAVDSKTASEQARALLESWSPFDVELTALGVFKATDVLYLEVGAGASELRELNEAMNRDALQFQEPFEYHPHVTLAQGVLHENVPELCETANKRWTEYSGPRTFRADRAAFVQNTIDDVWLDLDVLLFGAVALR